MATRNGERKFQYISAGIESLLGAAPDGGSGAGERGVALLFGMGALAAALVARRGRRSARNGGPATPTSPGAADA